MHPLRLRLSAREAVRRVHGFPGRALQLLPDRPLPLIPPFPARALAVAAILLAAHGKARAQLPDDDAREDTAPPVRLVDLQASARAAEFLATGAQLSVAGVRASSLTVRGTDADARTHGLAFSTRGEAYAQDGWVSVHRLQYAALGGGSGGVEGELGALLESGARLPLAGWHGLVLRGGIQAYLEGNDQYYTSLLELPRVAAAYQFLSRRALLEAGAQGGFVLLGAYHAGEAARRDLDLSLDWGAYLSLQRAPVRLSLSLVRIEARGTGTGRPVDIARGLVCGYAGKLALCTDLRHFRGDLVGPGGARHESARALYAGFMIGLATVRL